MTSRRFIVLCLSLGAIIFAWFVWRDPLRFRRPKETPIATIEKEPITFANRTFDPAMPPPDMPPLGPGETAECDSNFRSHASVGGQARQMDDTHAIVTITQVTVTLNLDIKIWVPVGVTQHVSEHEDGHRQISELYYQTADQVAERIATPYIGQRIPITGTDLHAEFSKLLQQTGAEITDEYNKELNPEATQLRYDDITDHSRNDIVATDAVAQALQDVPPPSTQPATNAGN